MLILQMTETRLMFGALLVILLPTAQPQLLDTMMHVTRQFLEDQSITRDVHVEEMRAEYDFIVVGSGPGGAVVANRLSEIREWNILLLEAGDEELVVTEIPAIYAYFQISDLSWGFRAQPENNSCLGLKDHRSIWAQGRVMGGTSVINAMMYTRGHPLDYDGWRDRGNEGWGWDDVLPYFKKSENAKGELSLSPNHGKGGYLDVQKIPYNTPLADAFINSAAEKGLPIIDYNSGDLIGFSLLQLTTRNGTRCSSNKAFLRSVRHRRNLHVSKNTLVTRILINPNTKVAYGVEFERYGLRYVVKAKKEVIISAGTVNTPKLLMLSGIGPRKHLEKVGVHLVHDLPGVGENLQDHVGMSGLVFLVNETVSLTEHRMMTNLRSMIEYALMHKGPVTGIGGPEALGFIRTPIARTPPGYPDIEFIFAGAAITSDSGRTVRKGVGVTDEIYDTVFKPINQKDAWTIWPLLMKQESKGRILLKSKNPLVKPLIYANYFEDKHDLDTLVEGIKFAVELSKTKAFQRYNSKLHDIPLPGCKQYEFGSDDYWRCSAQQLTTTLHHFCGTAKMGPSSDPMAVVDPELKVYGINSLRVVDSSIIPVIPASHTMAPTYMIAEKAADLIKRQYGQLQ
jgi:choline dehydrogenase-like flavoprotein